MKIETSELIGPALDWAVAQAKFKDTSAFSNSDKALWARINKPSTDWSQGGPIIEREGIELLCNVTAEEAAGFIPGTTADWRAAKRPIGRNARSFGPTPLIAAMRCFVASKLGDEVDVPGELL